MNFHELVSEFLTDTQGTAALGGWTRDSSLRAFLPELLVCGTILVMLLARMFRACQRVHLGWVAAAGTLAALYAAAPWQLLGTIVADHPGSAARMEIFSGMLVYDAFSVYVRSVLLGFALLFVAFTLLSGIPDRADSADTYVLFLGATLGLCLMSAANHLLMVFLAVEMASVPSYALAGLHKGRRSASEAALKYSVFGAGAAGVMLYGISLLGGLLGTVHLPTLTVKLADALPSMMAQPGQLMVLALAGLMVSVGLAFKLSAVPFHFWCPDVFEGATAEVNAFLSVASKAAALALLVRVALGFTAELPSDFGFAPGARSEARRLGQAAEGPRVQAGDSALFAVEDEPVRSKSAAGDRQPPAPEAVAAEVGVAASVVDPSVVADLSGAKDRLKPVRQFVGKLIAFLAILTCTFGNLAAYGQTNIKRLLAYSTIAHAGYMMMAVPALVSLAAVDPVAAKAAVAALGVYVFVYLFMNLGVFAIVAFLRNEMRSEEIADYAGLMKRSPTLVVCFALMLFSLVGLPPLAGFLGKFAIFAAVVQGFLVTGENYLMLVVVAGGLNTAISLFYYLRVVKVMTMEPEPESRVPFTVGLLPMTFVVVLTLPTAALLLGWNWLASATTVAASQLLP